jgi:hypothetical protein
VGITIGSVSPSQPPYFPNWWLLPASLGILILETQMVDIKKFKGINNTADPVRLSLGWMNSANNINVTGTGGLKRRDGYTKAITGKIAGAYSTLDFRRMYIVRNGDLCAVNKDMTCTVLASGLSEPYTYWAETNQQVLFSNGRAKGIIYPDNSVHEWAYDIPSAPSLSLGTGDLPPGQYRVVFTSNLTDGRETGTGEVSTINVPPGSSLVINDIPQSPNKTNVYIAPADSTVFQLAVSTSSHTFTWDDSPNQLGIELATLFLDAPPDDGKVIQVWKGITYISEFIPEQNISVIWYSLPFSPHLFNLNSDYLVVPGECLCLVPLDDALLIGTNIEVRSYTGDVMKVEADYGVVPGNSWALDGSTTLLWTVRGVCRALPFTNLTIDQVSVQSGAHSAAAILRKDGYSRFIVALQKAGSSFNKRG